MDAISNTSAASPDVEGIEHRWARVNDTELHFVAAGLAGSPILMVHGFPESWWAFHRVIPLLAANHRVFAVDVRVSRRGSASAHRPARRRSGSPDRTGHAALEAPDQLAKAILDFVARIDGE